MADLHRRGFRVWPGRGRGSISKAPVSPPTARELFDKMVELVNLERGITALYYYLPDETLTQQAEKVCQAHRAQQIVKPGVDRELRNKDETLASWKAVSAVWCSDVWQPGEILATFGFRIMDTLRTHPDGWSVIVDPQAKFFGVATAVDEGHRYWLVIVTGHKSEAGEGEGMIAAR